MKWFIEMVENGYRLPKGKQYGYDSASEAIEAAKKHVDDALPQNIVRVYRYEGHAFLAGDGSEDYQPEPHQKAVIDLAAQARKL